MDSQKSSCKTLHSDVPMNRRSLMGDIPTNQQINLCLRNVSNLLDWEYFCLKMLRRHSKGMGMMHHRLAKKIGIW